MPRNVARYAFVVLLASAAIAMSGHADAQSSLGIGVNEPTASPTGLFGGLLHWIFVYQERFGRMLNQAVSGMKHDGSKAWTVVAISFVYGVIHAAGPGHGKAVISSYMLANDVALRRGVMLSFVSAFLQAAVAVLMISALFLFLRGTAITMTSATWFLEIASYALVMCFGAWLLWQKLTPHIRKRMAGRPAHSLSAAAPARAHGHGHVHDHVHDHAHDHHDRSQLHADHGHEHAGHDAHDHAHHDHAHHDHARHDHGHKDHLHPADGHAGHVHDAHCGHSHAPDPALLSGDRFSWRAAWSAVVAAGLRPCSGALLVLTFAFLNGLWVGGILSVLAMALGTAITVSTLAILAVTAKSFAVRLAGGTSRAGARVHAAIEIGGAALVFLLGLLLLLASLREYYGGV